MTQRGKITVKTDPSRKGTVPGERIKEAVEKVYVEKESRRLSSSNSYPFVTPQLANLAAKYGFKEKCFAVYEKGYTNNGKKIKAKLYRIDINDSIKSIIAILQNSKMYAEYLKRPGMFEGNGSVPSWCVPAPTYHQLEDWMWDKFKLHFEILKGSKCIYPHGGAVWINVFRWKSYSNTSSAYIYSDIWYEKKQDALKAVISFNLSRGGCMVKESYYGPFSNRLQKISNRRAKRKRNRDDEE
jgi:hypothetical protein